MQVILREEVPHLGEVGDLVTVKRGYARNYLLPRGYAVVADARQLKRVEHEKRVIEARVAKLRAGAEGEKAQLDKVVLNVTKAAGENDKLFGSVSNLDYNGNPDYHRECASYTYGFHGADYTYTFNSYLGVKNGWRSGHAGGVFSAGIFNHHNWWSTHDYGRLGLTKMYCLSDFAIGGGYHDMNNTNERKAINGHWWGSGNSQVHNWNSHGVFVRRVK